MLSILFWFLWFKIKNDFGKKLQASYSRRFSQLFSQWFSCGRGLSIANPCRCSPSMIASLKSCSLALPQSGLMYSSHCYFRNARLLENVVCSPFCSNGQIWIQYPSYSTFCLKPLRMQDQAQRLSVLNTCGPHHSFDHTELNGWALAEQISISCSNCAGSKQWSFCS